MELILYNQNKEQVAKINLKMVKPTDVINVWNNQLKLGHPMRAKYYCIDKDDLKEVITLL